MKNQSKSVDSGTIKLMRLYPLAIAFLALTAYFCGPQPETGDKKMFNLFQSNKTKTMSVTELRSLQKQADVILVDVRSPGEFAGGHAVGAVNIPLDVINESHITKLVGSEKEKPVYMICRSGARSGAAIGKLSSGGFNLINIAGGTMAWQSQGFPTE